MYVRNYECFNQENDFVAATPEGMRKIGGKLFSDDTNGRQKQQQRLNCAK